MRHGKPGKILPELRHEETGTQAGRYVGLRLRQTGNTGNFCMNCGKAKPEGKAPEAGWTCPKCGAVNQGKFCMECGTQKPADAPLFKCDKCGWQPPDPHHPPKFCLSAAILSTSTINNSVRNEVSLWPILP